MPTATPLPLSIPTETSAWFTTWIGLNQGGKKLTAGHSAGIEKCPVCKKLVICGDDAPIAAFRTRVDPTPLSGKTELACLLAGRRTYLLDMNSGRIAIHFRDRWQITGLPPGKNLVLPRHQCGARFPEPPLPKESSNNECPF